MLSPICHNSPVEFGRSEACETMLCFANYYVEDEVHMVGKHGVYGIHEEYSVTKLS